MEDIAVLPGKVNGEALFQIIGQFIKIPATGLRKNYFLDSHAAGRDDFFADAANCQYLSLSYMSLLFKSQA